MKLFIRVKDGEAFEHPIIEDNFIQAFPDIDPENLPPEFALFIRVARPNLGVFEVYAGVTYEWNGYAYKDKHHVRPMTNEEKAAKIEEIKAAPPAENWVLDEETLKWTLQPPVEGGPWRFDFQTLNWVHAPEPPFASWVLNEKGTWWVPPIPRPKDDQRYRWDEPTLSWIPVDV